MSGFVVGDSYIKLVRPGAEIPKKGTDASVGYDVFIPETTYIEPAELNGAWLSPSITKIPLGIIIKPPEGYYFELLLRSSISKRFPGVSIPHSTGVLDPDFCGPDDEVILTLENRSTSEYTVIKGDRLCQLILRQQYKTTFKELEYGSQAQSRQGHGSTGR